MTCDLPLHVKPSPEYPLLHMQLSEPALFEQVAFPLQGLESHTSISRDIEANDTQLLPSLLTPHR